MIGQVAIPRIIGGWVVVVGLSLIGIILFGPYTHGNTALQPDPAYTRTQQSLVGTPAPFHGPGLVGALPSGDQIARGRAMMVANGCAQCHGIDGKGGVIGKPIVGFTAQDLRKQTTRGPGEMPAFAQHQLSDDDLNAIAAYLKSLVAVGQ